ncbi:MAG: hypothetical protein IKU29_07290 [Parabacteroides sp.]|nr:hypothetical protein [Parabacteroides sp.]
MANNKSITKATFNVPDGTIELVTWEEVLNRLDTGLTPVLNELVNCNNRLENIAIELERLGPNENNEEDS